MKLSDYEKIVVAEDGSYNDFFEVSKGEELPTFSLPDLGEDHFIGYRNADNMLVLPAEEDDE